MIRFEALNAKYGDALLLQYQTGGEQRLWVIDGGPRGTWKSNLQPRLEEIRGDAETLTVDVAMLSHVDEDHVTGILQLTKTLAEGGKDAEFLEIRRFWHNSFTDLVGSEAKAKKGMASLASMQSAATAAMAGAEPTLQVDGKTLDHRAVAVLASINQGRELRDYIEKLKLSGNDPFRDTLSSASGNKKIDEAEVTIVGPIASRLEAFREAWEKAPVKAASLASLFRDDLDESPTNLSSLVMLVKIGKRRILLTGDARGDDIIAGFKDAKLPSKMKLDILKMPHHGSDRNMTEKFLKAFPADHYVISADGRHGNPDPETIKAIVQVRKDDYYKIHLTNKIAGFPALLKKLSKNRNFEYEFRDEDARSIVVELD